MTSLESLQGHQPLEPRRTGAREPALTPTHDRAAPATVSRVLVPTRGSQTAESALRVARLLAARRGARVELVAVFEPTVPIPASTRAPRAHCETPDRRAAATMLRQVRRQRRTVLAGVPPWPVRFEIGHPPLVIADVAQHDGVDLVVLGIGRTLPDARRMGNETALRLAYLGQVPVLATASGVTALPRHALLAANGAVSLRAVRMALALLEPPARLSIAYALDGLADAAAEMRHQRLLDSLAVPDGIVIARVSTNGTNPDELLRFASRAGVDMLVVPVHGQSFEERMLIRNLAAPLLRAAHCSVLAVPTVPADPAERRVTAGRADRIGAAASPRPMPAPPGSVARG